MKTPNSIKNQPTLSMSRIIKSANSVNTKAFLSGHRFNLLFLAIFVMMALLVVSTKVEAGWMDDWVDQSTHSGPNYFDGQKRGYFNAGSYSARFRNKKDYLFSLQKPRLKSGCGGIDLFLGGFSFLDPEYLMQKLQRAIQAAPTVAFDLALKSLAPEISDTVKAFEKIINELNGLQISECAVSKEIASTLLGQYEVQSNGIGDLMSEIDTILSAALSSAKNYTHSKDQQTSNNNQPTQEQKDAIAGCSTEFKAIFTTNGSILEHVAENRGLQQYAPYMRAYLGDVVIGYSNKQYSSRPISFCSDQDVTKVDDIVTGNAKVKFLAGDCTPAGDRSLLVIVDDMLRSIGNKIQSRAQLSANEERFLNSIPFNVFSTLHYAVKTNNVNGMVNSLKDIIARMMAYAMVDDLVNIINELVRVAHSQSKQANTGVNNLPCEVGVVAPLLDKVRDLNIRATELQVAIKLARAELAKEVNNNIKLNQNLEQKTQ